MTREMLLDLTDNIVWVLLFAWLIVGAVHAFTVARRKERFKLATFGILIAGCIAALDLLQAVLYLLNDEYLSAGLNVLGAVVVIYFSKDFFDDDNWFNRKFKKLKDGLKNLGKRLSNIRLPSLLPSPSPA